MAHIAQTTQTRFAEKLAFCEELDATVMEVRTSDFWLATFGKRRPACVAPRMLPLSKFRQTTFCKWRPHYRTIMRLSLQVKAIAGLGTTIDVILVNGELDDDWNSGKAGFKSTTRAYSAAFSDLYLKKNFVKRNNRFWERRMKWLFAVSMGWWERESHACQCIVKRIFSDKYNVSKNQETKLAKHQPCELVRDQGRLRSHGGSLECLIGGSL